MPDSLDVAVRATAVLGEGPTWDAATGTLLWVDILASEVHRFDPAGGRDAVLARTPQHVGAVKPRAAGGVVVNLRDGVGRYAADGAFDWLADLAEDGRRGNDAAVDAHGWLWAGTMAYDERQGGGRLYRVGPGGEVVTVLPEVTVSNGIGWSPDGRLMYYIDTPTRRVDAFDVDPGSLTVDADGCVWVALWDGGAVHRYTPAGALDRVVEVPARRTTACAFGGPGLGDLYITTATAGLDPATREAEPLAGSVFVLPGAGTGQPGHAFAG
jgi:sugar lactone lactonase YvrE